MNGCKDCIDPPAPRRRKPVPHKCSTCGDRECRKRQLAVCWINCGYWKPDILPLDKFLEERGETYGRQAGEQFS